MIMLRAALAAALAMGATVAAAPGGSAAVLAPDLAIGMVAVPDEIPDTGGVSDLRITVTNLGGTATADVTLTLTLPPGAQAQPSSIHELPGYGWQCDTSATPVVPCARGPVEPGVTIGPARLPVSLPAGAAGTSATVTAQVSTSGREAVRANNTATAQFRYVTAPRPGDLTVSLAATPAEVEVSGLVELRPQAHQIGTFAAPYLRVDVAVPDNLRPVSSHAGGYPWNCTFGRDVVTGVSSWYCKYYAPLAPGESTPPLVLSGYVDSGSPGDELSFTAGVLTAPGEDSTANNTAQATVSIVAPQR